MFSAQEKKLLEEALDFMETYLAVGDEAPLKTKYYEAAREGVNLDNLFTKLETD